MPQALQLVYLVEVKARRLERRENLQRPFVLSNYRCSHNGLDAEILTV